MRTPKSPAQLSREELAQIAGTAKQLRLLQEEMGSIFVEREQLIWQIIFALLTREHILINGEYGTGKSDLLNSLLGTITGATTFSIELSKFMSEGHLVGMPNPKILREEGHLRYEPEGSILVAHFAMLDELFDAPPALLRVLLGILNERMFKRGRQIEAAMLHTAAAATNGDPEQQMRQFQELGAVVDRFLFHNVVEDVETDAGRIRMYEQYLRGRSPQVRIPYSELDFMSAVVVGANQIHDVAFIVLYDQVLEAVKKAFDRRVSPRRACKALQLVEASALLNGRIDVHPEDIVAIKYALCVGGRQAEDDAFMKAAEPIVEEYLKGQTPPVDALVLETMKTLEQQVQVVRQIQVGTLDLNQLAEYVVTINELLQRFNVLDPQLDTSRAIMNQLKTQLVQSRDTAFDRFTKLT